MAHHNDSAYHQSSLDNVPISSVPLPPPPGGDHSAERRVIVAQGYGPGQVVIERDPLVDDKPERDEYAERRQAKLEELRRHDQQVASGDGAGVANSNELLADGEKALHYFNNFIPLYNRFRGSDQASINHYIQRFNEQRNINFDRIAQEIQRLGQVASAEEATHGDVVARMNKLWNSWSGQAADASKQAVVTLDDQVDRAVRGLRAIVDLGDATLNEVSRAVNAKVRMIVERIGASTHVGGWTPKQIDRVISAAKGGDKDACLRAAALLNIKIDDDLCDDADIIKEVSGRSNDWLTKYFVPDVEGKAKFFDQVCDITRERVDRAWDGLNQTIEATVNGSPFKSGQPCDSADGDPGGTPGTGRGNSRGVSPAGADAPGGGVPGGTPPVMSTGSAAPEPTIPELDTPGRVETAAATIDNGDHKIALGRPGPDGDLRMTVTGPDGKPHFYSLDFGEPRTATAGADGKGASGDATRTIRPGPDGKAVISQEDGTTITVEHPPGDPARTIVTVDHGTGEPTVYDVENGQAVERGPDAEDPASDGCPGAGETGSEDDEDSKDEDSKGDSDSEDDPVGDGSGVQGFETPVFQAGVSGHGPGPFIAGHNEAMAAQTSGSLSAGPVFPGQPGLGHHGGAANLSGEGVGPSGSPGHPVADVPGSPQAGPFGTGPVTQHGWNDGRSQGWHPEHGEAPGRHGVPGQYDGQGRYGVPGPQGGGQYGPPTGLPAHGHLGSPGQAGPQWYAGHTPLDQAHHGGHGQHEGARPNGPVEIGQTGVAPGHPGPASDQMSPLHTGAGTVSPVASFEQYGGQGRGPTHGHVETVQNHGYTEARPLDSGGVGLAAVDGPDPATGGPGLAALPGGNAPTSGQSAHATPMGGAMMPLGGAGVGQQGGDQQRQTRFVQPQNVIDVPGPQGRYDMRPVIGENPRRRPPQQ